MPTLYLLRFKANPILPKRSGHWALFLPDEEASSKGLIYTVRKRGFKSKKTQFSLHEFNLQSPKLESCCSIPEIDISPYKLSAACHDITKNRPFHLIKSNCQHWVQEVIENLINRIQTVDDVDVFDKIKRSGYFPIFSKKGIKHNSARRSSQ